MSIPLRLSKPRIPPLQEKDWTPEQRDLLMRGNPKDILNIFRTLATHPDLFRRWLPFGNHVLFKSTLPARERELAILRVGVLCRSGYEFAQHTAIGKRVGLTDDEIERVKSGPSTNGWSPLERALLTAVDELVRDAFITDETWAILTSHFNIRQMIDLVFAVGQYQMVSMALNSFGVQLEDVVEGPQFQSGMR